jgi:hypothetical protein
VFDDFDTVETVEAATIIDYIKEHCNTLSVIRTYDVCQNNVESIKKIAGGVRTCGRART